MPQVRYTGGGHYRVAGVGFDPGDERAVEPDLADYLTDRDDFEVIDDTDGATDEGEAEDEADGPASEALAGDDFSENGWLDNDYQDRADAVRGGGLDDHLDAIKAAETSDTVIEAVEDRRSELED